MRRCDPSARHGLKFDMPPGGQLPAVQFGPVAGEHDQSRNLFHHTQEPLMLPVRHLADIEPAAAPRTAHVWRIAVHELIPAETIAPQEFDCIPLINLPPRSLAARFTGPS